MDSAFVKTSVSPLSQDTQEKVIAMRFTKLG
jgi:hypothetical protein